MPFRWQLAFAFVLAGLSASFAPAFAGKEPPPFAARFGVELAAAAATVWAPDSKLVYLENDEALHDAGTAARWGYLFFSPALQKSRIYSVRDGRIVTAEDLEMKFEAPALVNGWLDSGEALTAAELNGGREFRGKYAGTASTMLLLRGAFNDADADQTTWTVIYSAPHTASLFVMLDAATGRLRRTWRG